jgi:tRNA-binding EMAP/Myf-like protein
VIIDTVGAVVGQVVEIRSHPDAQKIWLSYVRVADSNDPMQIVFGGIGTLNPGDLVPVAPPGARVKVLGREKLKKIRSRRYRGVRSHGMLCSLRELGWVASCINEVAVLRDLLLGQCLDAIDTDQRHEHVENWSIAEVSHGL